MIAKTFSLNSPCQNAAVALTPLTPVTLLFGAAFGHNTQRAHSMRFANYSIFFFIWAVREESNETLFFSPSHFLTRLYITHMS